MPHIVVEYSSNLEERLDMVQLVKAVHATVLSSKVFEVGAVRTRAAARDNYVIADGDPDHAFIHIEMVIAPGRDDATRKRVSQGILDVVAKATKEIYARRGLALSVNIREIDNASATRLNNLHERMAAKT
jgi:5-carboxymethyl-2-hydroxymuconate isomerase